jgi:hypothetical protein
MEPLSGQIRPSMRRRIVDLPLPECPMIIRDSPLGIVKETFFNICLPPME